MRNPLTSILRWTVTAQFAAGAVLFAHAAVAQADGKSVTNSIGMKLVWIEKGEFDMGSPEGERGRSPVDETQHRVILTKSFYMGATEVTQKQWTAVMSKNPSPVKGDDLPVIQMSYNEAVEFCKKLGEKERKTYRLPTEAEWEYACRAGTTTAYCVDERDLGTVAWYDRGAKGNPVAVGKKVPNAWGLFDMHGNAMELCSDWYAEYEKGPIKDPTGPAKQVTGVKGAGRVLRGGAWNLQAWACRSAERIFGGGTDRQPAGSGVGFRVVLEASDAGAPEKSSEAAPAPGSKDATVTNSIGVKLVWIEKGAFDMGSPAGETGRHAFEPQHRVTLTKGFYMGTTEITQKQWAAVMGTDPSRHKGDNNPVDTISWDEAVAFCRKLSEKEKKKYRLPTEAEWEYACRAGSTTAFHEGKSDKELAAVGWYKDNSEGKSHPVGEKKPNAWGLYDMHGNAKEWCADWTSTGMDKPETDPTGPLDGKRRILRGGSWQNAASACRSAVRNFSYEPMLRGIDFGFRVVMD